ncbi:MAG TPA: hypothetical protein PLA83_05230 [Deltaproteobacteria bacterium]|jgi:hypothetical protein|nr:hypothetical protein [Deltaproteobacteria bacterium]HQI01454.1 hypothetical protein [Deltaproteobacteria bacterium]HQJ08756.1 hypothetical protein [Deltaproteobacteria bacterium]
MDNLIENNASEVPFSFILSELIESNLKQRPEKMKTFNNLCGAIGIDLKDIEAAVTLFFQGGRLKIEQGIVGKPDLVIRTDSDKVVGLNSITIKFGLPYYFDEAGMAVLKQLISGELKVEGMLAHPVKLTRLTKIMSVM